MTDSGSASGIDITSRGSELSQHFIDFGLQDSLRSLPSYAYGHRILKGAESKKPHKAWAAKRRDGCIIVAVFEVKKKDSG